jgi:hypothetical protein
LAPSALQPGARMAVAAFFTPVDPANPTVSDPTWSWLRGQWAEIAAAGGSVRVVVAGDWLGYDAGSWPNPPAYLAKGTPENQRARDMFVACKATGQKVYGYLYGAGGLLPLYPQQPGHPVNDPLNPRTYPALADQVEAWLAKYTDGRLPSGELVNSLIDGFFIDVGPTDCTTQTAQGYNAFAQYIRQYKLRRVSPGRNFVGPLLYPLGLYLNAPGWPDVAGEPRPTNPSPVPLLKDWMQRLDPEFIGVWEADFQRYKDPLKYGAADYCAGGGANANILWDQVNNRPVIPSWWDPGPLSWLDLMLGRRGRDARAATITGVGDANTTSQMIQLAVSRGTYTIFITLGWQHPVLGTVYDRLPPPAVWNTEVALLSPPLIPVVLRRARLAARHLRRKWS